MATDGRRLDGLRGRRREQRGRPRRPEARKVTGRLAVGREPRGVALSPDGSQLLVGNARSQDVSLIDARNWTVAKTIPIDGDNLRQVAIGADGKTGTSPT